MSDAVLLVQDALAEVAPDWEWSFTPLKHRGEDKFKVVAKQRHTTLERTVYVSLKEIVDMPTKEVVREIMRFLPLNKRSFTLTEDKAAINVGQHYTGLRDDYRKELDRLRRMTSPLGL